MEKKENISKETFAQTIAGEIKQTTLKNGLRIVTADWPQVESVMVSIFVNTGSSRESEAENGISHFIEHLMFKGAGKRNAQQITADIANVGGSINAYTEKEFTCYDAHMLKEHLELATDVLADFIMAPTLDPEEINREKGVVIQEINRYADIPGYIVNRYFLQTAFPNQAMGRSTLGTPENIRRMDKAMIQRYLRTHYVAGNIVAAAVGRVDHDKFVKMVEDRMSALPEHSDFAEITPHYVGGEKIVYLYRSARDYDWIRGAVCHECFHALQHKAMYGGWFDWLQKEFGVTRGRIKQWRVNSNGDDDYGIRGRYFDIDDQPEAYLVQVFESDARAFEFDCAEAAAAVRHLVDLE